MPYKSKEDRLAAQRRRREKVSRKEEAKERWEKTKADEERLKAEKERKRKLALDISRAKAQQNAISQFTKITNEHTNND